MSNNLKDEAMKRIAGAPVAMGQSTERDAAFEEWIYSQRADVDPYEVWHAACAWQSRMRAALSAGEAQQVEEGICAACRGAGQIATGCDEFSESICRECEGTGTSLAPPRQMVAGSAEDSELVDLRMQVGMLKSTIEQLCKQPDVVKLRAKIAAIPDRIEAISGQHFSYIKRAEVLDTIDSAIAASSGMVADSAQKEGA